MIADAVILPGALDRGESTDSATSFLYDLGSGLLLTDDARAGTQAVAAAIMEQPAGPARERLMRAMTRLVKSGRMIEVPVRDHAGACDRPGCERLRSVARSYRPALIVHGRDCRSPDGEIVAPIDGYIGSAAYARLRNTTVVLDASHTLDDFCDRVVRPLTRYAPEATIVDRQIGRHLQSATGRPVKDGFASTLHAIATELERGVLPSGVRRKRLRIVTGLQRRAGLVVDRPLDELRSLERYLRSSHPAIDVDVDVRLEEGRRMLDHDRYLITKLAAVQVGRGFDLGIDDAQMRQRRLDPATSPRPLCDRATCNLMRCPDHVLAEAEELQPLNR